MALVAGMSSPPLSQPGDRAGLLFQAVGFSPSGLAMAPGSGPGFTSSSERGALSWGPGHPVVARGSPRRVNPAVAWPKASGSRIRNVWPARPRRTTSRHRSSLTSLRAFHRVTSGVDVCAGHLGPEPTDPGGFAFTIETGSDFPIGPTDSAASVRPWVNARIDVLARQPGLSGESLRMEVIRRWEQIKSEEEARQIRMLFDILEATAGT